MPVKKIKEESERDEYILIGISSLLNDYRICFFLNQFLEADFCQIDAVDIISKGNENSPARFRVFGWKSELSGNDFFLFNNTSEKGNMELVPEIKKVNFILKITGKYKSGPLVDFLRKVPEIASASVLPLIKIKSHKNLDYISFKSN